MKTNSFILLLFLVPFASFSQKSIEFTAGAGYTAVDIERLVEIDESTGTIASDWGLLNFGIGGQYLFASKGNIGFGAELMYQYLYWYSVRVPHGNQTIYRDYSVSAIKLTPIIRFGVNNAFAFDLGPEFNFSDGMKLGMLMSANYYVPISDKIDIPIKARLDIINKTVVTLPISFNMGIRIKI